MNLESPSTTQPLLPPVYPKIKTVFDRDEATNFRTVIFNKFSSVEFEYLRDCRWTFTEKVDGANTRIFFAPKPTVLGRTDKAHLDQIIPATEDIVDRLSAIRSVAPEPALTDLTIYGESYGPKIQSGGRYSNQPSFVIFDILFKSRYWFPHNLTMEFCEKHQLPFVPHHTIGTLDEGIAACRKMQNSFYGPFIIEGLVARPVVELRNGFSDRIICKMKTKDFSTAGERG